MSKKSLDARLDRLATNMEEAIALMRGQQELLRDLIAVLKTGGVPKRILKRKQVGLV